MKYKLEYLQRLLELYKHRQMQREKRIRESNALSPEYDYLKINNNGLLKEPYEITNGKTTRDKVLAAAHIRGIDKLYEVEPGNIENQYYSGYKEIFDRVKKYENREDEENEKHSKR